MRSSNKNYVLRMIGVGRGVTPCGVKMGFLLHVPHPHREMGREVGEGEGEEGKGVERREKGGGLPQREGSNRLSERKPGNGCSFLSWSSLELRRDL